MEQAAEIRHAALSRGRSAALLAKQKAAAARRAHLESLKGREEHLCKFINALTATSSPANHASAGTQLTDLRDLAHLTETTGWSGLA